MSHDAPWTTRSPGCIPIPKKSIDLLNQLGRDGWELVHIVEGYGVPSPMFHLERPV